MHSLFRPQTWRAPEPEPGIQVLELLPQRSPASSQGSWGLWPHLQEARHSGASCGSGGGVVLSLQLVSGEWVWEQLQEERLCWALGLCASPPTDARLGVSPGSRESRGSQCGQSSEGLMACAVPHLERKEYRGEDGAPLGRRTLGEGWAVLCSWGGHVHRPQILETSRLHPPMVAAFLKPDNKVPQHIAGIETPVA